MTYLDLTHRFTPNMPAYPGDPLPDLKQVTTIEKEGFIDFEVTTGMHVGTHVDGPAHMVDNGRQIVDFPVDHFFGRGVLIDVRYRSMDLSLMGEKEIQKGDIVLFWTGWSEKWKTEEYFYNYPVMTPELAQALVEAQVKMVGFDTTSPDGEPFGIHKLLLKHEVLILENLTNLSSLEKVQEFEVIALPVKFETDSAPARVVAKVH